MAIVRYMDTRVTGQVEFEVRFAGLSARETYSLLEPGYRENRDVELVWLPAATRSVGADFLIAVVAVAGAGIGAFIKGAFDAAAQQLRQTVKVRAKSSDGTELEIEFPVDCSPGHIMSVTKAVLRLQSGVSASKLEGEQRRDRVNLIVE